MFDVLLVDNEAVILDGLIKSVDWGSVDCRVTASARDGSEAIDLMRKQHFDIVISDIRMPEMDGLALAEWISENKPSVKTIVLTGFPDFDYAKKAIDFRVVDFVIKPTNEENLFIALEKAKKMIVNEHEQMEVRKTLLTETQKSEKLKRSLLLNDLIYNPKVLSPKVMHQISDFGIDLSAYYVIRVGVYKQPEPIDYSDLISQAQEFLTDNFAENHLDFVQKSDRFFYAILAGAKELQLEDRCRKAVDAISKHTDFFVTVGISHQFNDPMQIQAAVKEADNAQMFAEYNDQVAVMNIARVPDLTEDAANFLSNELRLLESAIEHQSRSYVEKSSRKIFQYIRMEHIPFSSVQKLCAIIWSYCNGLLIDLNFGDASSEDPMILTDQLSFDDSIDETEKQINSRIYFVLDCMAGGLSNIDSLVHVVKNYVDQNFQEELSLELLASKVHLSASYLSRLFKREIGLNLSTYIQNVRIEEAKILLRSTMMKTYEVAEAVGIGDPVYFSKMFKKATGFKPKEYRANERGGD